MRGLDTNDHAVRTRHATPHAPPGNHFYLFFFFNDTATTEIYTLSLHDALPISLLSSSRSPSAIRTQRTSRARCSGCRRTGRSEEHTSELQSQSNLVCRLLLEKKKRKVWRSASRAPSVRVTGCALCCMHDTAGVM